MKPIHILITLIIGLSCTSLTNAASFDCNKAATPDEGVVCADRSLNDKDVEMATAYRFLSGLFPMGTRGNMLDAQRAWLQTRAQCKSDKACLNRVYTERLTQLNQMYDEIDKPL